MNQTWLPTMPYSGLVHLLGTCLLPSKVCAELGPGAPEPWDGPRGRPRWAAVTRLWACEVLQSPTWWTDHGGDVAPAKRAPPVPAREAEADGGQVDVDGVTWRVADAPEPVVRAWRGSGLTWGAFVSAPPEGYAAAVVGRWRRQADGPQNRV